MKNILYYFIQSCTVICLLFAFVIIFNGCKKSTDYGTPASTTTSTPAANEVFIQNTAFNASSITVAVNTTVKWTNKDGVAHTVTSTTGLFDSGNIAGGGTYSHQFTTAGSFPYKCQVHSSMTGTVIVN